MIPVILITKERHEKMDKKPRWLYKELYPCKNLEKIVIKYGQ